MQIDSRRVRARRSLRRRRCGRAVPRRGACGGRGGDPRARRRLRRAGGNRREPCATAARRASSASRARAGKTSTKDILAALCAPVARTVANEASFNAELGVPLTLCRLEPDTELCLVEMGMRGFGQIAELCRFARPDVGVITRDRPGAPRARRLGRRRRAVEGRAAAMRCRRVGSRSCRSRRELDPYLREDLERPARARGGRRAATRTALLSASLGRRIRFPLRVASPGAERAHGAPRVRGARPAARPRRGGRGRSPSSRAGATRSCRYPAAASSSTTPGTRTRPRCRGATRTSPSVQGIGGGSPSWAGWPSSATDAERYHRELGCTRTRARHRRARGRRARPRLRRRRVGARRASRLWRACASSSGPVTRFSSRPRARSGSKASPLPWRTTGAHGPSPDRRPGRDGDLDRDRPEVHRVPAPERARTADPRGGAGRTLRQAGDAGHGRAPDPASAPCCRSWRSPSTRCPR